MAQLVGSLCINVNERQSLGSTALDAFLIPAKSRDSFPIFDFLVLLIFPSAFLFSQKGASLSTWLPALEKQWLPDSTFIPGSVWCFSSSLKIVRVKLTNRTLAYVILYVCFAYLVD